MASGEWRVASGEWRVASGEWRVASGEWRVVSGVPGTPYLTAWTNSGKSGREQALRLLAIRQAPGATGVERLWPRENVQRLGGSEWGETD